MKSKQRRTRRLNVYLTPIDYTELVRRAEALEVAVPPATLAAQILSDGIWKKPQRRPSK